MNIFEFWREVTEDKSGRYIHHEDESVLSELSHLVGDDLDFSFPPGPIFGPLKTAKIVLCYANPGIDDLSLDTIRRPEFQTELFDQLAGINNYPHHLSGWKEWFNQRANSLFDGDIELAGKHISVFNLIPYASVNMDKVEKVANCLPSVWVAQNYLRSVLIPKAKSGDILLIMCRSGHLWGLKSAHGCDNILINNVRSGFSQDVKNKVKEWCHRQGI
ncbi:hypothetical protein [Photobacterium profundum]|uniref:Uncharacterized protein n=1 Tax=Photobacterium profundum (strain SS9) TaxID=298386 RepID=Q6LW73_PHOPR|nr:hypothetical protein [Photobacterium profundum]CAG17999.1 hypothetical protein PBPRC0061 [Photobacterium profundum SS9]